MQLTVRYYDLGTFEPLVLLHRDDCAALGVREGDRVRLSGRRTTSGVVGSSGTLAEHGTAMVPGRLLQRIGLSDGDGIGVVADTVPESVRAIRRKMDGETLTSEEVCSVVGDLMDARLSLIEVSAWLTALQINGMDTDELASYTVAMSKSGGRLDFGREQVFDFHSFGGVPGNKITPIVVSIVAAAGHIIPKLSSRAISSACGTADYVETFCRVDLGDEEVRRTAEETGGVFSWTGATDLAPAGDVFITVQRPLGIDPRPQMLASIMSKKIAAGATHILMDIPMGRGTKVATIEEARSYARDLMDLGDLLGVRVECAVTSAEQPLGEAVGPVLEARECMQVLELAPGHEDVADKACICAGIILEMAGEPDGASEARRLLESGRAHEKFLEIAAAQGGDTRLSSADMVPGRFSAELRSPASGVVTSMRNKAVVAVAKAAGAPGDKGAGMLIRRKTGDRVREGEVLATVYAESEDKLGHAVSKAASDPPFEVSGMVMGRVGPRDRRRLRETAARSRGIGHPFL